MSNKIFSIRNSVSDKILIWLETAKIYCKKNNIKKYLEWKELKVNIQRTRMSQRY